MPSQNWGDLTKSAVDSETVEQAIARLIAEHNDNNESHLAVGQSLQSHKAYEIIDHLANSIVPDKLSNDFFSKTIIVPNYLGTDAFVFSGSNDIGIDAIRFSAGGAYGAAASGYLDVVGILSGIFSQSRILNFSAKMEPQSTASIRIGLGDITVEADGDCIIFYHDGTNFKCRTYKSATDTEHLVTITGVTISAVNQYRIEYYYGVRADFYVNDILVGSIDSDLPDDANGFPFGVKITDSAPATYSYIAVGPLTLYTQE